MEVILASQSPRRKELLGLLHIPFTVRVADIDETPDPTLTPAENVARLSRLKAAAVPHTPQQIVIAADTLVVYHGEKLGKPTDAQDAKRMLRMLSGNVHQVMTGMTVLYGQKQITCTEITDVHFRTLSEEEIDAYIASGDPMDKAGAYGIQSGAAGFVPRIEGDYYNVVGLPVCRLSQILKQLTEETP